MTVPLTASSFSLSSSMVPQARARTGRAGGQDQAAFLVLLGEDEGFHRVADGHNLIGVDVVAMDSSREGMTPSVL